VALVDPRKIRLVAPGYQGNEGGKDPAERQQQGTGLWRTEKHDEWIIDAARLPGHRNSAEFGVPTRIRQALGEPGGERKGYMMRLYMRRSLFGYGNI
jgi:hypothetical protein